jgi:patatin-like phospholipase/acyl hydrolase
MVFTSTLVNNTAKFNHETLENHIKDVIKSSCLNLDSDSLMKDTRDVNQCKAFVVAVPTDTGGVPVRLRTYDTATDRATPALIWEAARATSAALTYFAPITIDHVQYCDGGFGWSNPTEIAIAEAHNIWPNRPIGCLLSIGTGIEDAIQLDEKYVKEMAFFWEPSGTSVKRNQGPRTARLVPPFSRVPRKDQHRPMRCRVLQQ